MSNQISGVIRHIVTLLGGILVAFGFLTEDVVSQFAEAAIAISGGVLTIIAIIKSWNAPEKKKAF
jgi:uncharacterized protein (DUF697 family)